MEKILLLKFLIILNFINGHDWTYNSDDGYYYYRWIVEPDMTTSSLISGVTLNQDLVSNVSCDTTGNTYNCSSDLNGIAGATYTLTFTKETVAYSKYQSFWDTDQNIGEYQYLYSLPNGRTADTLQMGDEICINGDTTECFNFIRYDGNNIVMLAEYNLNVGSNAKVTATNLQDSDVRGYKSGMTKYGVVTFSETNYWEENDSLKSKYGSSYPADVYDTDYSDATGNNYSVAFYVENYKNILESYGPMIKDARLLTYSEATTNVGCSGVSCPSGFITNTSFWLGSAYRDVNVWFVFSNDIFSFYGDNDDDYSFGVRPVIVISKDAI